jgi:transcriptional regulator GlxA family with amidase domain
MRIVACWHAASAAHNISPGLGASWSPPTARNLSVAQIAAQVAVSPRTLDRRFKQCTGDSPQLYLQKLRVEAGTALLENTKLRMSDVLERIGYGDESTFRRLFKRHTSLSPRDYRRRFGVAR